MDKKLNICAAGLKNLPWKSVVFQDSEATTGSTDTVVSPTKHS